jgi:signal transduction histidine kinase
LNNISVEPLAESVTGIVKKSIKVHSVDIVLWLGDKILCYGDRATDKNLAIAIRDEIVYSGKTLVTTETVQEDNRQLYNMLVASKVGGTIALSSAIDNEDILGLLVLGVKNSGAPFNREDAATLGIVAGDLSVAVQNSLHYEEIQKFNETLQAKVDDATRKLQRTNDKLKQLDETKDEFISMASHQLRTPLTSVKGYLSMVLEGDVGTLNDMQRKLLMQSFNSSQRMVYLISDLLNLSRLRTGKFIIEPKVTNLADVIEGEVEQLSANAKGRGLTLNYNKPKNFPDLYMDETKIRQVIMNFADNAIYYTPSGGKIDINLVNNKDTIEFTVVDNGIGVPLADQKHMFTKFYRAKNAQKARPDGTGLGIFMAKKVIIAQGGALIFESKPDKGSTFGFSISKSGLKVPE